MFTKICSGLVLAAMAVPVAAHMSDTARTIRVLEDETRRAPRDGGAAIELAAAYQRAGRTADADTAFRRALTLDNAMLETPTGDAIWSHAVARRALTHDTALASR